MFLRDDPKFRAAMKSKLGPKADDLIDLHFPRQDDAFMEYLFKKYGDAVAGANQVQALAEIKWSDIVGQMNQADRAAFDRLFGHPISDDSLTDDMRQELLPVAMVEGETVLRMRFRVLKDLSTVLGDQYNTLFTLFCGVRVALLPSFDLNGFVMLTLDKRPIIVMNSYMIVFLPVVMTTVYAASGLAHSKGELSWWKPPPSSHANTLVGLARMAITGDPSSLKMVETQDSMPPCVAWSIAMTKAIQEFILLHEYGHIFAGDLHANEQEKAPLLGGEDEFVVSLSEAQEWNADVFAAGVYAKVPLDGIPKLSRTERATAIACLFQFLDLCDYVRDNLLPGLRHAPTHLPPHVRLNRLSSIIFTPEIDTDFVNAVLSPFRMSFQAVDSLAQRVGRSESTGWRATAMGQADQD